MSINDATPSQWDKLRAEIPAIDKKEMSFEEAMTKLDRDWVYNGTLKTAPMINTTDASDFAECWAKPNCEVNNPPHYNTGVIECIEAIEESMTREAYQGYLKGNCQKYIWRMSYKGKPLEDLKKAQWYLQKLINSVEEEAEEE